MMTPHFMRFAVVCRFCFFFSSRRRHTRFDCDWSSDVCSSDLVRDRPLEAQQQADQQHAKFDDEKSEFSGYLRLWKWLQDARGGKVVAKSRKEMATAQAPEIGRASCRERV